jgi:hypothetical protein
MTGGRSLRLAGQFAQRAHNRLKQEDTQGALACAAIAQATRHSPTSLAPGVSGPRSSKIRPIPRSGQSGERPFWLRQGRDAAQRSMVRRRSTVRFRNGAPARKV